MTQPLAPRGPSLRIVCVNDVYTLENFPRLRSLVLHEATSDPADVFLVTLAGDFVSPSLLSSLDAGRGMVDCMNAVPITHVIFGNHEDDLPIDELRSRVREFRGTWLSTNVCGFDPPLTPFQILEVCAPGGRLVRVGLVGVVLEDPAVYHGKPFGGASLLPASAAARGVAAHLIDEEGCACVIPLTHQDMASDRALARAQLDPPFPVIIGGHEHAVFLEKIGQTWVIKAGSDAVRAAVVDLSWPPEPPAEGPDLPLTSIRMVEVAGFPEDAPLRARVDGHLHAVHALEQATLLHLSPGEGLSSVGTRRQQTTLGTRICSSLRDSLGAEAALFNGGGIRASRDYQRRFTYGDLKAEVPFDNEIVVVSLPGRVVREAIASSRSRGEAGAFLQLDDRAATDPDHHLVALAGLPLDDDRDYRVATVRNLFDGMDHIEPLRRFALDFPSKIPPHGSGRDVKLLLVDAFARAFWAQLGPFDSLDTNHDGSIDPEEIAAAVARVTAEPASAITVELLLKALDTNHDRKVSRSESEA